MVLLLLWIDWHSTQPINPHAPKCRKYIHSCLRVFSVPSTRIFSALLCQAPSLSYLISGVRWHALLSLPHYRTRAFVSIARKKMFRIKFASLAPPCVELVCIYATYQYIVRSTQAARRFLRSVCILMLLFQD